MNKSKFGYKIKGLSLGILFWELIFWLLFALILLFLGAFSNDTQAEHLLFKDEEKLYYLILLLPLFASFLWFMWWKNKRFSLLGDERILTSLLKPIDSLKVFWRFFLLRNTFVFIVLALAQPVFGDKKVSGTFESMELVLAIDVSNSMNCKDIDTETSRLEIVKRAMNEFVNHLHGEKVGISIFAGSAFVQLPLTTDYEAVKMYIHEIQSDMLSNQGTNIASALDVSMKMFSKSRTSKAILLVTDGENHEGGVEELSAQLKENNITLAVLGIGTTSGGYVPNNPDRPEMGYKTSEKGLKVVSKLNPVFLQKIAQQADGFSFTSSSQFPNLDGILDKIKQLKRSKVDGLSIDVKENWYQIPLFLAMLCFLSFVLPLGGVWRK